MWEWDPKPLLLRGTIESEMKVTKVSLILFIACLDLGYHGSGAMPDGPPSSSPPLEQDLNIGKNFAHCTKLLKDNYAIWMAGIITILMSYKTYKGVG